MKRKRSQAQEQLVFRVRVAEKVAAARRADVAGYVKRYPHMHEREVEGLEELFVSWDDDGSGEMNMEEMAEVLERIVRDLFDRIDKNGNGVLEPTELFDQAPQPKPF